MLVKPAPGRAIRAPGTMQLVPEDGLEIDPNDFFWVRALRDEDVVECAPEAPAEPAPEHAAEAHEAPLDADLSGLAAHPDHEGSDA